MLFGIVRCSYIRSRFTDSQGKQEQDYAASFTIQPLADGAATGSIRHSPGFGIAASIMWGNARNAGCLRVLPEHLPDDLLAQAVAANTVPTVYGSEYIAIRKARRGCPSVNGHLNPCRHQHSTNTAVLPPQIHDAPAAIALLDMREG